MFLCQLKCSTVAAGEMLLFLMIAAQPPGADRVDYIFGWQPICPGDFGTSRRTAAELLARSEQPRACGTVNTAVYPAAAPAVIH